ncbi:MAG TPA: hypothetical protein VNC50_11315 [Planctomycetia bacterium]|nr:hypothetical protein [Planctomycetia bacterium]
MTARPLVCVLALLSAANLSATDPPRGLFTTAADIGAPSKAGSVKFDSAANSYAITGGGANMWFAKDSFQFLSKTVDAAPDLALAADVEWITKTGDPHRKACLMFRAGPEPDAAYVDVALHGDGLTSLQFRAEKGGPTREVQSNLRAPARVRLIKRGSYVLLFAATVNGPFTFTGAAVPHSFNGQILVGLGVCAHDDAASATAVFRNVTLGPPALTKRPPQLFSALETQSVRSTDRKVVYVTPSRIEAPNWTADGESLLYNAAGRLLVIPAAGGDPAVLDTGFAVRCNNDHGFSPDGAWLAISDQSQTDRKSRIYVLPFSGGTPKLVTPLAPSYWHGWSPDGKTLVYCAERGGEYDVYSIPVSGGDERRLTDAKGLDDGPEYSPDGKHIYFNSDRAGRMQIWRMNADGSDQRPIVADELNNWFAHPSPDGKTLVFLSYAGDVKGHPENKDVSLRRLNLATGAVDVLGRFFGGQGTINVPCWSPNGASIAFVTYQLIDVN